MSNYKSLDELLAHASIRDLGVDRSEIEYELQSATDRGEYMEVEESEDGDLYTEGEIRSRAKYAKMRLTRKSRQNKPYNRGKKNYRYVGQGGSK